METRSKSKAKPRPGSQMKQSEKEEWRDNDSAEDTDYDEYSGDSATVFSRDSSRNNDDSVDGDISHTSASPSGRKHLYPDISRLGTPSQKSPRGKTSRMYPDLSDDLSKSPGRTPPNKPLPSPAKEDQVQNDRRGWCIKASFLAVCVLVAFMAFSLSHYEVYKSEDSIEGVSERRQEVYKYFKSNLKELQKAFSQQDRKLWTAILAPLKRVLSEDNPTHPAVLLFVVPKEGNSPKTAQCLARKVVAAINMTASAETFGYINSIDLRQSDEANEKKVLDGKLREILNSPDQYGVVVDHIEELSPFAMLLFHGYCDGDNAPFKKSVIILVIHMDRDFQSLQNEAVVDSYLHEAWTRGLEEDKVPPLIARVANNKVVIKGEKETVLKKYCGLF